MSIEASLITTEGLVLRYQTDPVMNITAITALVESSTGTGSFVGKTFRYTKNGVKFSDWAILTEPALTALSFNVKDIVYFEFEYVRDSIDSTIEASITLTETVGTSEFDQTFFNSSIFAEFFEATDLEPLKWTVNVLQKIYNKENLQLAKYIKRGQDVEDEDFIDFWTSIARFFAYYVIYTRQYRDFKNIIQLLVEYLEQRGLTTSRNDILSELQELLETYYEQVSRRGTIHIIDDKDFDNQSPVPTVWGELLRLIDFETTDEFLFNLHMPHKFGWNLGNSSPLYRGLQGNDSLNKNTKDGYYVVDPSLSYELSFAVEDTATLKVVLQGFDIDKVSSDFKSHKDGTTLNTPLDIELYRTDVKTYVRIVLFASSRTDFANDTTNLNQGNNLRFTNLIRYIKFLITDSTDANIDDKVTDIRLAPCFTNYSHGMLQVYNWISVWLTNNNQHLLDSQLKREIRQNLIPYNSHLEIVDREYVGEGEEGGGVTPTPTYAWRGKQAECEDFTEVIETEWVPDEDTAYCEDDNETYIWIGDEATAECIVE